MNRLTYTKEDDGYLTLWPPRRLGNDFNQALRKVKGGYAPRGANGYALSRVGKSEYLPPGIDLQDARMFATQWTDIEPVTICEAVAIGLNDTILFRKVERLQSCERFDEIPENAELVVPGGELMMKRASDPKMPQGFDQLADKLTRGLVHADREWFKPYLRKYMNVIRVDWKRLNDVRQREIWNKAERVIKKAKLRRLTEPWTQRITHDMTAVSKGTKKHLRAHYMPRLNTALTQPDTKAIGQIGTQQGWFLRDQMGKRSEALTKHGERIVKRGLKDGWGREQIANELDKKLPGMWKKYAQNYSTAVASVALSRARSWSEVNSYQDIGIEQLEIQAILDEATTDYCRMIDGQVISVNECSSLMEQGANVQNPEDIKTVNPFMTTRRDPETGQRSIFTATGTRLADITRSGHGIRDDRGEYRAHVFGNKLPSAANIGMPPYHHLCRTYTLPKTTMVQIPKGYQGQAVPIPPRPVPIKPKRVKPKPTGLIAPKKVQPRPALITGDRPVSIVKTPQPGKPTDVGFAIPHPDDPYARDGIINGISLEKQMIERSQRAMKKLSDSIAKQQKKLKRPLTRQELGDNLVKEIKKEVGVTQSITGLTPPRVQHKRAYKSKRKLTELYTEATRFTGERLMKELKIKGMASIVPIKGTAYYTSALKRISVNPKRNESLRHEYGHHLSTLGKNLEAEVLFRKRHTTGSYKVTIPGGGSGKPGNWGDQYCSRMYPGDVGTEVFSQVYGLLSKSGRLNPALANMWEANPEHIGFVLSYLQGAYI